MLPDQSQGNPQQVDPRLLMQMMMARRAQQGAIPGAAAPQQATAQQNPTQQPSAPQAGVPGAAQPQSQPQAAPQGGAARQLSPASPTPFNGTFGDRKGVISQLVNSAEKGAHDKKAHEAEMYYNQINSFLASGQPDDQKKAQALLDDPKIRKVLKAGLDYVPLEEAPPPEALGIHQAQQKIQQKQNMVKKLQTLLTGGQKQGSAQQSPPGRAVIPQASQAAQGAYAEQQAKIGEQGALAQMHAAEAAADKQKADAETSKAESEKVKALADLTRSRGEAKWYEQQAKASADKTPSEIAGFKMGNILKSAQAQEARARGKYYDRMPQGKLPGQVLTSNLKSAQEELNIAFREAIAANNKIQGEVQKQSGLSKKTGGYFGLTGDPSQDSHDASEKVKKFREAMAFFVGEGTANVRNGTMSVPDLVAEVANRVGIDIPPPAVDTSDDEPGSMAIPDRPSGVPTKAVWDPATRTWSVQ